jgi:hypothetical protein
MIRRLAMMLLVVAGMVSAQTLQQDMQRITDAFDALPPAREVARQQFKDPQRAELMIDLVRMNTRIAEESEVRARYAKGKERRGFRAAQKRAERAEWECIRQLGRMEHAKRPDL